MEAKRKTKMYVDVDEVCEDWGVSRCKGYEIIRNLKKQMLKENPNYITLPGKINRNYYEKACGKGLGNDM